MNLKEKDLSLCREIHRKMCEDKIDPISMLIENGVENPGLLVKEIQVGINDFYEKYSANDYEILFEKNIESQLDNMTEPEKLRYLSNLMVCLGNMANIQDDEWINAEELNSLLSYSKELTEDNKDLNRINTDMLNILKDHVKSYGEILVNVEQYEDILNNCKTENIDEILKFLEDRPKFALNMAVVLYVLNKSNEISLEKEFTPKELGAMAATITETEAVLLSDEDILSKEVKLSAIAKIGLTILGAGLMIWLFLKFILPLIVLIHNPVLMWLTFVGWIMFIYDGTEVFYDNAEEIYNVVRNACIDVFDGAKEIYNECKEFICKQLNVIRDFFENVVLKRILRDIYIYHTDLRDYIIKYCNTNKRYYLIDKFTEIEKELKEDTNKSVNTNTSMNVDFEPTLSETVTE